jgi:hypothetical protein
MAFAWTKSQRRLLHELTGKAYERELARALGTLEADFARWHRGEIDAHELSEPIHRFHNGPARRLYAVYTSTDREMAVGAAIGRGILSEEEATPEILEALKGFIELARDVWAAASDVGVGATSGSAPSD